MHIYLIRHAHAEDGDPDALRELSRKGRRQARIVGRFLREREMLDAREFWHSPFRRARETAEILAKHLKSEVRLVETGALKPQDHPQLIARRLRQLQRPIAVVGHDPHLSALASLLVAGEAEPPHFVLKKCAVVRLDRCGTGWSVRWQISPEVV
jgi:phosphohistidine phosphatase